MLVTAGVVVTVLAVKHLIHRKRSYDLYKIPTARGSVPLLGHVRLATVRVRVADFELALVLIRKCYVLVSMGKIFLKR